MNDQEYFEYLAVSESDSTENSEEMKSDDIKDLLQAVRSFIICSSFRYQYIILSGTLYPVQNMKLSLLREMDYGAISSVI